MTREEAIAYAIKFRDQLSDAFLDEVKANQRLQEQLEAAQTKIYNLTAILEDVEHENNK